MFKTEVRIKTQSIVDRMKSLISRKKKDTPTYSMNDWFNEAVLNEIEREEKAIQKHN